MTPPSRPLPPRPAPPSVHHNHAPQSPHFHHLMNDPTYIPTQENIPAWRYVCSLVVHSSLLHVAPRLPTCSCNGYLFTGRTSCDMTRPSMDPYTVISHCETEARVPGLRRRGLVFVSDLPFNSSLSFFLLFVFSFHFFLLWVRMVVYERECE